MHIRTRSSSRRVNGKPIKRYQAVWYEHGREFRETFDTRELGVMARQVVNGVASESR